MSESGAPDENRDDALAQLRVRLDAARGQERLAVLDDLTCRAVDMRDAGAEIPSWMQRALEGRLGDALDDPFDNMPV